MMAPFALKVLKHYSRAIPLLPQIPMAPDGKRFSRGERLFLAELAGEAERYEDVITQLKEVVETSNGKLVTDERNLLSVAYKNIANSLRNAWRVVNTLEQMQTTFVEDVQHVELIRQQRQKIERELSDVCNDAIYLLDTRLLLAAGKGEESVFYAKMKGDYYRYLAEFSDKQIRDRYADNSLNAYKLAYKHALSTLDPLHPTRLGLALNFSVFYHDVRKSPERACHLAKSAFDDAVMSLNTLEADAEQTLRDTLMILQLLKDDLVLWSAEMRVSETD